MVRYRVKSEINFSPKDANRVENAIGEGLELTALQMKNHIATNAASLFDNGGPRIVTNLWDSGAKYTRRGVHIKTGWKGVSAEYGWVLEFGPNITDWTIVPRKAKMLRFYSKKAGKIVFARKVNYHWSRDMLRPHWEPALKEQTPQMLRRINNAVVKNGGI